jgi:hypothetical protein
MAAFHGVSQGKRGANSWSSATRHAIALGGVDQARANAGLERAVAGVRHDHEARLRPGARQRSAVTGGQTMS